MAKIIEFLQDGEEERVKKVLSEVNGELKNSLHEPSASVFSGVALARHLLYYSMALSDMAGNNVSPDEDDLDDRPPENEEDAVKTEKEKRSKSPVSFRRLVLAYASFCEAVGGRAGTLLTHGLAKGDLEGLCHFKTWRRGAGKPNMYASLLLFVIYLYQTKALEHETVKRLVPDSEKKLAPRCEAAIRRIYDQSGPDDHPEPKTNGSVDVTFWYAKPQVERLERFVRYFQLSADSCAHFVIYRTRRNDPRQLMKSFVAFKPPWALGPDGEPMSSSSYNFTHIYAPPEGRRPLRISNGRLVPLDGGLYCVGGQKDMNGTEKGTFGEAVPFKTLKILAMDWTFIDRLDFIFPALVMSANFDGEHLLSRAYLRATPVARSDSFKLGAVPIHDLRRDLEADFETERREIGPGIHPERFLFDQASDAVDSYVADIISKTNNNPSKRSGWEVSGGFASQDKARPLTQAGVSSRLEDAFPPAAYRQGEPPKDFDFWSDIRFGPLVTD